MAIWHSSIEKPSYKALVSITEKEHPGNITNFVFEGKDTGEVINKTDEFIEAYFSVTNKEEYTVTVSIVTDTKYVLRV